MPTASLPTAQTASPPRPVRDLASATTWAPTPSSTLPSHLKLRDGEGKYLFKKTMEPLLPNDVLYRPKMGFAVPLARWFRGPLRQRVRDAVLGERLADTGWFEPAYLRQLVDRHQSGQNDFSAPLWTLMMFEGFLRQVVDAPESTGLPVPEVVA